jgi:hypothetical protein
MPKIELEQAPEFQRREWTVQRVGWALMLLVVGAGMAGAFGRGPLSSRSAGGVGFRLEYERLLRHRTPSTLELRVEQGAAVPDGTLRVWISGEYLQTMEVERILPEPEGVQVVADGFVYSFRTGIPDRGVTVFIDITPEGYGSEEGRIRLGDGPPLHFAQFVFP